MTTSSNPAMVATQVMVPATLLMELRDAMWDSTVGSRFDNAVQALIDLAPEGSDSENSGPCPHCYRWNWCSCPPVGSGSGEADRG